MGGKLLESVRGYGGVSAPHMCAHTHTHMHVHAFISDDVIMGITKGNPLLWEQPFA